MSKCACDFACPDICNIQAACHFIPECLELCHVMWRDHHCQSVQAQLDATNPCVSDRKNGRIEREGVIEKWAIKWQDVAGDAENEGNLNQRREMK